MIDYYEPDIVTAQDYYPFGMLSREALPNSGVPYKFGFNGKMNDNEVKGGFGLQQDYGMRIYDNRVGRFLSVDPITKQYPELTPFQFASNNPVQNIDLDGLEGMAGNIASPGKWHIPGDANDDGFYTKTELKQGAAIAGLTTLVAVDAVFTKGLLTRTFGKAVGAYLFLEVVEHTNRNSNQHDPKIRAQNEANARNAAANLVIGLGTEYLFAKGLQATKMTYQEVKGIMKAAPEDPMIAGMSKLNGALPSVSKGNTIGLGVGDDLASFRRTDAITWRNAGWQEAGLTKGDYGKMAAGDEFAIKEAFRDAANNSKAIRFDVTNFDPFYPKPGITNYEFNYINNNPALLQKTTFIQNGAEVKWDGKTFINK